MAVEDKYALVAANTEGLKVNPAFINGNEQHGVVGIYEKATGDSDLSIIRFFRVPSWVIPKELSLNNDAISGFTDANFGLYKPGAGGVAVDDNVFADAVSLASARGQGSDITLLSAVDIADSQKRLWELAAQTADDNDAEFDIAMTMITAGSTAGTIVLKGNFLQG